MVPPEAGATAPIYTWSRAGRRPATIAAVLALWLCAGLLWALFGAAWGVLGLIVLASLPLAVDVIRNPQARLEVYRGRMVWASGLRNGAASDILTLRLDRRFDGGFRITVLHPDGTHRRLPPDIAPPAHALEQALDTAGIPVERHPFSPF